MFHSYHHFHRNSIALAALFLAAKVEEQPRKLEHVIKMAHICLMGRDAPPLDTRFVSLTLLSLKTSMCEISVDGLYQYYPAVSAIFGKPIMTDMCLYSHKSYWSVSEIEVLFLI